MLVVAGLNVDFLVLLWKLTGRDRRLCSECSRLASIGDLMERTATRSVR